MVNLVNLVHLKQLHQHVSFAYAPGEVDAEVLLSVVAFAPRRASPDSTGR